MEKFTPGSVIRERRAAILRRENTQEPPRGEETVHNQKRVAVNFYTTSSPATGFRQRSAISLLRGES